MANFPKINDRELLSQKVYRIIKQNIVQGKLEPQTRLFEEDIAKQMGISRTPVREALRLLSAEGFVTLIPNIGIVVNQASPQYLLDILNIRLQLDPFAAGLAAEKITEEDIKNLEEIIQQTKEAVTSKNVSDYNNLNLRFHKSITSISRNKELIKICINLYQLSNRWTGTLIREERLENSLQEHIDIYNYLKDRNIDNTKQAMHLHLQNHITHIFENGLKEQKENEEK